MKISEQMLAAYVDGELDDAGVAAVESAMRIDPEVAERVARSRALRASLRQAYAPVLDEPVPERLLAAATAAGTRESNVVSLSPRSPAEPARRASAGRLPHWAALAASLVLGLLLAPLLGDDGAGPFASSGDALLARGELVQALDRQLASEAAAGPISVGLSFRGRDGNFCRTFTLTAQSLSGLACRQDAGWRVSALGETRVERGELRRAASALPAAIAAEVDARIVDEPLDADGERKARDAGWR